MKRFLIAILSLALLAPGAFAKKKKQDPITIEIAETFYVVIIDNLRGGVGSRSDRFHYLSKEAKEVAREMGFPMKVEVVRFGHRTPPSAPLLNMVIVRWGQNGLGDIEARFNAVLKQQWKKESLGIALSKDSPTLGMGSTGFTQSYNTAARKSITKIFRKVSARVLDPELKKNILEPESAAPVEEKNDAEPPAAPETEPVIDETKDEEAVLVEPLPTTKKEAAEDTVAELALAELKDEEAVFVEPVSKTKKEAAEEQ